MKKNSIFSELFDEMGVSTSSIIWMVLLNILRVIAIFAAVVLAIAWIITQNHDYGWALIWPAVAFIITAVGGFVLGARMMLK